jgi:hypothetical protein
VNERGGSGVRAVSCAYTNRARDHADSMPSTGTPKSVSTASASTRAWLGSCVAQPSAHSPASLPAAKFSPLIQIMSTLDSSASARASDSTRCTASAVSVIGTRSRVTPSSAAAGTTCSSR